MAGEHQRPTVLLVDDDSLHRWIAAEIAEDAGFAVIQAPDADIALAIISDHREVEILVTDVHMPGSIDGIGLARMVHDRWPWVELIIVSGQARLRPMEIPDNGIFLPKPYNGRQFVAALNRMADRIAKLH